MNRHEQFCQNDECRLRGQLGKGNIVIHSKADKRYRCKVCGQTFTETKGTPFFHLKMSAEIVALVLALLSHGCPTQAIVIAFGIDERTVSSWLQKAGDHCKKIHEHTVQQGKIDIKHVQADEIWVKMVLTKMWMAMAIDVSSRLWLGGVVSQVRDLRLITTLVEQIRRCAISSSILLCVDGLSSYVTAFKKVFRNPIHTGKAGRPHLEPQQGLLLGQVVKKYEKKHVAKVIKRAVIGTLDAIISVITATCAGVGINTSYIERLNATFRGRLHILVRRGRAIAHKDRIVTAGMYLVGCVYNFCCYHRSLREASNEEGKKWYERTPAMAAGLTNHRLTMLELLRIKVPLPLWVDPPRRGRPPRHLQNQTMAVAA